MGFQPAVGAGVVSGAGFQPASYIDSVILRDRDNYTGGTPNPMTSASDGTLEERRYSCQNWRADVVAVTKSDGTPLEYVRYSAYGEPTVYPVADLNMDGVVNSTDSGLWSDLLYSTSNSSVYADTDLDWDGADDQASSGIDSDLFYESYNANTGLSGVGRVSSAGVGNRTGYAGYQWDQTISACHVRYRVYMPDIGRWTRRDPLGYVDGMGLYEYVGTAPTLAIDNTGLQISIPITLPRPSVVPRPIVTPYPPLTVPLPPIGVLPTDPADIGPLPFPRSPGEALPNDEPGVESPPYSPNPNRGSKNPCKHLINEYKRLERVLAGVDAKDANTCAAAAQAYRAMRALWQNRWWADRCLNEQGLSDGKHGIATGEAALRRVKFYEAMRDLCNKEMQEAKRVRDRAWEEFLDQHPNLCPGGLIRT